MRQMNHDGYFNNRDDPYLLINVETEIKQPILKDYLFNNEHSRLANWSSSKTDCKEVYPEMDQLKRSLIVIAPTL